jgi:type II secretory pathway pseudopilin PulG
VVIRAVRSSETAITTAPAEPTSRDPSRSTRRPTTGMTAPYRNRESAITREKVPRSTPSSAETGLRNGPIVKRIPADRNTMIESARTTHHP